jgi:hypothetical protein
MITVKEHLAGLFVAGLYYWLVMDDELGAWTCWDTADMIFWGSIQNGSIPIGVA